MQTSYFKHFTSLFSVLMFSMFSGLSQSGENPLPYNPDSDGNGSIEVSDLVGFLTIYGEAFIVEGAIPIENGGTGATSVENAKLALTISLFSDVISVLEGEEEGDTTALISGDLKLTGKFQQGSETLAEGDFSTALGISTTASGSASYAEGYNTQATNTTSHAEGYSTLASGLYSHAENRNTIASAICAHAEGENTSATADASHSEGLGTTASGFTAHAEGYYSVASGSYSHSGGRQSSATAVGSFANGFQLIADQTYSAAFGKYNLADRNGTILVVGNGTSNAERSNIFELDTNGALINGNLVITGSITSNGNDLVQTNNALIASVISLQNEIADLDTLILDLQGLVSGLQDQIDLITE